MEAKRKILRAKVNLQKENPFFAYLISNMDFVETDKIGEEKLDSMAVDSRGNCYYNPQFIEKISNNQIKGVLAHEVMHLVFDHLSRVKDYDRLIWNIATDLCINDLLKTNGFEMLSDGLVPNYRHEFEIGDIRIEDINNKKAEDIYHEILRKAKNNSKAISKADKDRFDKHLESEGGQSKEELKQFKDKWKKAISEASAYAKDRGNLPEGIGLLVDDLLNEKVDWKQLLYKYLTKTIPHDYTYARPSRRSFSVGVYMPMMRKEEIDIVVSLDTSGSISQTELTDFMSEINGIAKSFSNLNMKLIVCDSEIKDVYHIGNGDDDKISKLEIRGGGGTSHKPVYDYVSENLPNTRLLVNFTDGYTEFPKDTHINSLWVLCSNGCKESNIPFGEVIKLK